MTNYDMDEIERKRDSEKSISDWVERQADYNPDMVRLEPREHFDWCIKGVVSRANLHVLCYDHTWGNTPLFFLTKYFQKGNYEEKNRNIIIV